MRRLALMVNDVNAFTGSHHQCQTIILKRLESVKEFLHVFVKKKTQDFTGEPLCPKILDHLQNPVSPNKQKLSKTLLESFGTTCSVLPLSGIWSEVFFHHLPANVETYSYEYQNFQEAKTKKIRWVRTNTYFLYPCPNNNVHTGHVQEQSCIIFLYISSSTSYSSIVVDAAGNQGILQPCTLPRYRC